MPDTVSKTDNFLKAIEKYAEQQRTQIESEAEDFKQKELDKAEEEGLREAYGLIQKKMTDIKINIAGDLSRAENASRKKTFTRRKEIEDSVFEEAERKLRKYTETEKYLERLSNAYGKGYSALCQSSGYEICRQNKGSLRKRLSDRGLR